jgi:hypothetical protein
MFLAARLFILHNLGTGYQLFLAIIRQTIFNRAGGVVHAYSANAHEQYGYKSAL